MVVYDANSMPESNAEKRRLRWKTPTEGETVFRTQGNPGTCAVQFTLGDVRGSVTFSNQGHAKFSIGTSNAPLSALSDVRGRVLQAFEGFLGTTTDVETVTVAAYTNLFDETRAIRMAFVVVLARFPMQGSERYYRTIVPGTRGALDVLRVTLCEGNLSCASIERAYRKRAVGKRELTIFQAPYGDVLRWTRTLEARFPGYAVSVSAPSVPGTSNRHVKASIRPITDPSIVYKRPSFTITRYGHVEIRGLHRPNEIREARDMFVRQFPRDHIRNVAASSSRARTSPDPTVPSTSAAPNRRRSGCGRALTPPCTEGYEERPNPRGIPCCYKRMATTKRTTTRRPARRGCGRAKNPPCPSGYEERPNPSGTRCCYKTPARPSSGGCGRAKKPPCEQGYRLGTNPKGVRCCYKLRTSLNRAPRVPNVPERVFEMDVPSHVKTIEELRDVWPRNKFEFYFTFDPQQRQIIRQRYAEAVNMRAVRPQRFAKEESKLMLEMRFQPAARAEMTSRVRAMILTYYESVVRATLSV